MTYVKLAYASDFPAQKYLCRSVSPMTATKMSCQDITSSSCRWAKNRTYRCQLIRKTSPLDAHCMMILTCDGDVLQVLSNDTSCTLIPLFPRSCSKNDTDLVLSGICHHMSVWHVVSVWHPTSFWRVVSGWSVTSVCAIMTWCHAVADLSSKHLRVGGLASEMSRCGIAPRAVWCCWCSKGSKKYVVSICFLCGWIYLLCGFAVNLSSAPRVLVFCISEKICLRQSRNILVTAAERLIFTCTKDMTSWHQMSNWHFTSEWIEK